MSRPFTIGIAGSGGDGVILLGELLARTAAGAGLHCFLTKNFGPQIRGGETSCRLTIAIAPLHCPGSRLDLLAVLDWNGLAQFRDELNCAPHAAVLADMRQPPDAVLLAALGAVSPPQQLPLEALAMEAAGSKQARNMVLGGALLRRLNWETAAFTAQLALRLAKQSPEELARNAQAVETGWASAPPGLGECTAPPLPAVPAARELLTGNAAVVRGALAADCRFMAGYPISPATEILEALMHELPRAGGDCVQAEDEIAAAGLALGAAYGGRRSMTATSGPGLSLKVETLGLAVMAEQPLVVVDVQRCGPSTGIPTRTEQSDLNLALYGRHGDAPLPVLAPVDIADCASLTAAAFELADAGNTPVLLLSDQYLAQGVATVETDIPLRSAASTRPSRDIPQHPLTGLEHDSAGQPGSDPGLHDLNSRRRSAKIAALLDNLPAAAAAAHYAPAALADNSGPRLGILTWGSSFGAACAAADMLAARGIVPAVYAPRLIFPLAVAPLQAWLEGQQHVLAAELNSSGQFLGYLRSLGLGLETARAYRRAGGRALTADELLGAAEQLLEAVAKAAW